MAEIKVDRLVDFLYSKFPDLYRQKDATLDSGKKYLYLFLKSMFEGIDTLNEDGEAISHKDGAGEYFLNKINRFTDIIDPEKCPDEMFPYLLASFGVEYNPLIENKEVNGEPIIYYHRKFLANIGELVKRIGTVSGLRYLVRVLTGMEFEYSYERTEDGERKFEFNLLIGGVEDELNKDYSRKVIEQFLKPFIPFYLNLTMGESITYVKMQNITYQMKPTNTYSLDYQLKDRRKKDGGMDK